MGFNREEGVVGWMASSSFVLQSTTDLSSMSSWRSFTNEVSVAGGKFVLIIPMLYDRQYFRVLGNEGPVGQDLRRGLQSPKRRLLASLPGCYH